MDADKHLHLHLPHWKIPHLNEGQAGVFNVVARSVEDIGWTVTPWALDDPEADLSAPGYHIHYSRDVVGPRSLNLRKCYRDPFYRLEATNARWEFDVVAQPFEPTAKAAEVEEFMARFRPKFLQAGQPTQEGHLLMPLQGKLSEHRSFQSMSPIAMIEETLKRCQGRRVLATLHPNESYDAADLDALAQICARHPNFTLSERDTRSLMLACHGIVTQNSSVAFSGFFAGKPAVLFAQIDFHHIAGSVPRQGLDAAFAALDAPAPDYDAYLFWFLRQQAISFWPQGALKRFRDRMRHFGWPV